MDNPGIGERISHGIKIGASTAAAVIAPITTDLHPIMTPQQPSAVVIQSEMTPALKKVMAQLQEACYFSEGQAAELGIHYGESGQGITCTHQAQQDDLVISVIRPDSGDPYVTRVNTKTGEREIITGPDMAVDHKNENITVFNAADSNFSTYVNPRFSSRFSDPLPPVAVAIPAQKPTEIVPSVFVPPPVATPESVIATQPVATATAEPATNKPNRFEQFTFSLRNTLSQIKDNFTRDKSSDKPIPTTTVGSVIVPNTKAKKYNAPPVENGCYSYSAEKEDFIATKPGNTMTFGNEKSVCVASFNINSRFNIWKNTNDNSLRYEIYDAAGKYINSYPLEPASDGWIRIKDLYGTPLALNIDTGESTIDKPLVIQSVGDAIFAGSYGIPCGAVGTLGQYCTPEDSLDHTEKWINWVKTHNPGKEIIKTIYPVLNPITQSNVDALIAEAATRTAKGDRWFVALTIEGGSEQDIKEQITTVMNQYSDNSNIGFVIDVEHFKDGPVPISKLNRINEHYASERIRLEQEGTGFAGVWYFRPPDIQFDEAYKTQFTDTSGSVIATAAPIFDGFGTSSDKWYGYNAMLESFHSSIGGMMDFTWRWGDTYDTSGTDILFDPSSVNDSVRIMAQQ